MPDIGQLMFLGANIGNSLSNGKKKTDCDFFKNLQKYRNGS